jgi:hypothetical protein
MYAISSKLVSDDLAFGVTMGAAAAAFGSVFPYGAARAFEVVSRRSPTNNGPVFPRHRRRGRTSAHAVAAVTAVAATGVMLHYIEPTAPERTTEPTAAKAVRQPHVR